MSALSGTDAARPIARVHVGCRPHIAPGWIHAGRTLDNRERETLFVEAEA